MKKMLTLVLVAVMIAMTCLPAFAAIDANGDIVCDECCRHDQVDDTGIRQYSLNRIVVCEEHRGLHDAEELYVYGKFVCYRCDNEFYEFIDITYRCLP